MSGLKNSPFGKRLRASHREPALSTSTTTAADDRPGTSNSSANTTPNRTFNPIFGISSTPCLSLDSSSTLVENGASNSPTKDLRGSHKRQRFVGGMSMGGIGIVREYGDRFVPSKDSGDLRTSYHLMEDGGGPSTPSKARIIPSESDALKGEFASLVLFDQADGLQNKLMLYSILYYILKSPHLLEDPYLQLDLHRLPLVPVQFPPSSHLPHPLADVYSPTTHLLHQILQHPLVV